MLPFLLLIVAGLVDASRALAQQVQLQAAVQAGADYAQDQGWDPGGIRAAVGGATELAVSSEAPILTQACATSRGLQAPNVNGRCPGGERAGYFVRVAAATAFTSLAPWPGLDLPRTQRAEAVVRIG